MTKVTKGTASTPTTRAGRSAKAGKETVTKSGVTKPPRKTGSYGVNGQKVEILQTHDKHKLWADLFSITQGQIQILKEKSMDGGELDPKEMSKLDSCFNGIKRLIEIESQLKSDAIASMTTEDLVNLAKKAVREANAKKKEPKVKIALGGEV